MMKATGCRIAVFVVVLAVPELALSQVFVRTLLDRSKPAAGSGVTILTQSSNDASIDDTLKAIDDPTKTDADILTICDGVAGALKNRWAPVKWSPERSVCFWTLPKIDYARAAQVVGGTNEGTAAVEVAADVFWGLRVRVQTAVSGTNTTGATAQAKTQLQQLVTSGGNVSIGATYPWYAYQSSTQRVMGVLTTFTRVGGSVAPLGAGGTTITVSSKDVNGSIELAPLDFALQLQSFRNSLNFVLAGRLSVVNGSHKFNDTVGNSGHRGFAYGQAGAGLRFAQVVWATANWRRFSRSSMPNTGTTFSLMFGK